MQGYTLGWDASAVNSQILINTWKIWLYTSWIEGTPQTSSGMQPEGWTGIAFFIQHLAPNWRTQNGLSWSPLTTRRMTVWNILWPMTGLSWEKPFHPTCLPQKTHDSLQTTQEPFRTFWSKPTEITHKPTRVQTHITKDFLLDHGPVFTTKPF